MNTGVIRVALLAVGCLGLLAVVRFAARPLVQVSLPPVESATTTRATIARQEIAPESVSAIATRDPFRANRRPALPGYDPLRLAEQLAPPPPRPALLLVGIVDGASPSAVIEGFPGVEGSRVVRTGEVVSGLTVKTIRPGHVIITGMDTTWVLEVREPWKP